MHPSRSPARPAHAAGSSFPFRSAGNRLKAAICLALASSCGAAMAAPQSTTAAASGTENDTATQLDTVRVVSQRANRVSNGATNLDLDIKETPQSISLVSGEQMQQFGIDNINDALRLATGIQVEEWETNRTNYVARGFDIKNTQIDGVGLPNDWGIVTGAMDAFGYEKLEVIRGAKREVPADWRSLTVTGRARSAIRRHIRTSEREEFVKLGRAALQQTLTRVEKTLSEVSLKPVLETLAVASDDDVFEELGRGRLSPTTVAETLFPALKGRLKAGPEKQRIEGGTARLFVRGGGLTPGVSVHFGQCCTPVPGDRIVGILEPETGLTVHTIDCQTLADFADDDSVWHDLQWTPQAETDAVAAARIRATIRNAPGVLGQVTTLIGEAGGNIINMTMAHRQQDFFDVDVDVEVEDAKHATSIIAALRANPSVDSVERARGG